MAKAKSEIERQRELEQARIEAKKEIAMHILADWDHVRIEHTPSFWTVSGYYKGEQRIGVNTDLIDVCKRMVNSFATPAPVETPVQNLQASPELMALLNENEDLQEGKQRLLKEYDMLTQRLLDDKYEMSRVESDRHESISAILLELRS